MKKTLRLCRAFLFLLFLLPPKTRSFSDSSSNVRVKEFANDRQNGVSNLESIFGGGNIENSNSMNLENVDGARRSEDVEGQPDKSVRTKRNSLENRSPGRNSISDEKGTELSSRIVSRNVQGSGKIRDKSADYSDVSGDEGSEEEEVENEDEGKSGYKSSEFKVGENGERYIDQEERAALYDDFEAKDVVKRGISGAEDYEELEEKDELLSEPSAVMENAAVSEGESTEEEIEGRKVRGNLRTKRNREKGDLRAENVEKREVPSKGAKETKVAKRTAKSPRRVTREKVVKRDKEFGNREGRSKEDAAERDEVKVDADLETDVGQFAMGNENSGTEAADEKMQATDEKMQAADEKMQATDEKMQAADEKMQAADSNSVNEEGQEIGEKKDAKLSSEFDNSADVSKNENSPEDAEESAIEKKAAANISTDQKSLSDSTNSGEESKIEDSQRNERQESEGKPEAKRSNDAKILADPANSEKQESTRERKEVKLSNDDPKIFVELINPSDSSKTDDSRVVEISSPGRNSKIDSLQPSEISFAKGISKVEQDSNIDVSKEADSENYEKRVEEEIQRKIDSIKDEIKREVERNRQIREIEENNAKFDEIRDREDEEQEGNSEVRKVNEKRRSVSKRFVRSEIKSPRAREEGRTEKRSARRKKREEIANAEKVAESETDHRKESGEESEKKRAVETSMEADAKILPIKKRDYERQVILMRSDRGGGRKRRRKRRRRRTARSSAPAKVKMENLNFRGDVDKPSSVNVDDEREEAEGDSSGKRSDSVASLAGNAEDVDPRLATEYGEAFGGLQSEPGVALARFKRIKRVLQTPSAKT